MWSRRREQIASGALRSRRRTRAAARRAGPVVEKQRVGFAWWRGRIGRPTGGGAGPGRWDGRAPEGGLSGQDRLTRARRGHRAPAKRGGGWERGRARGELRGSPCGTGPLGVGGRDDPLRIAKGQGRRVDLSICVIRGVQRRSRPDHRLRRPRPRVRRRGILVGRRSECERLGEVRCAVPPHARGGCHLGERGGGDAARRADPGDRRRPGYPGGNGRRYLGSARRGRGDGAIERQMLLAFATIGAVLLREESGRCGGLGLVAHAATLSRSES